MKIYSQLISAQLENKASDYSATVIGRVWWNTATGKVMSADGTNVRALLRNDANCVFGNHATAANNIRFHRGASGVLQFVSGADATAEGTLSTSLNQISGRAENYTNATRPSAAAGNAGRVIYNSDATALQFDTGGSWVSVASGTTTDRVNEIYDIVLGSAAQVTAGVATHSSWASAISAATAGDTIYVLDGAWTENVTVSKQLHIIGSGFTSALTGSITFTNASDQSFLEGVKVSDNITLNAGADGVIIKNIWLANGKSFLVDSTVVGELVEASRY